MSFTKKINNKGGQSTPCLTPMKLSKRSEGEPFALTTLYIFEDMQD